MNKYLIELGTEELPYKFIPDAVKQLKDELVKALDDAKIEYKEIKTLATPRRLTAIIECLPEKQEDTVKEVKGPIATIAYDEQGNLTKAALGFANKNGISPDKLFKQDNYVFAKVEQKGTDTKEALASIIPNAVMKLKGSHFMRWADLDIKFQRPIRWIVSLFNSEELPVEIATIKSSNISRGHRFSKTEVKITNADTYENELLQAHVIVDQDKRKDKIAELSKKTAKEIGADIVIEDELLEEVTFLTEWPIPVVCDFEEKYLDIPEKVTVTVMATHQRYFPLYKQGKLLNKFITVSNYIGDEFANIKAGNERVVRARLEDAIFFFKEDTQKPLEASVEALKGVTFQKGLGSVYDKTQRVIQLAKYISDELKLDSAQVKSIERTALLSKADLVTSLVFEFTELQGFIGADYARISGETKEVSQGIKEHYFPLNAESELAEGIEGQVVGIADKIDTITAVFSEGRKITGSQDPLGVRRATLGILKTIINKELDINLDKLIEKSISILPVSVDKKALYETVKDFFVQRLKIFYSDKFSYDVIDATEANKNVLADLKDFTQRLEIVSEITAKPDYDSFHEAINRVIRIIKNEVSGAKPDETLFVHKEEKDLWGKVKLIDESAASYKQLESNLIDTIPEITSFFDKVLVMDENEKIKQNRINLLTQTKQKFDKIADFSKIVR